MSNPIPIVIPTYNERANPESIVTVLVERLSKAHVVVVDDNSLDGTGALADELARRFSRVRVIHRPAKEGIGPAHVAGFKRALALDSDSVAAVDASGSHSPPTWFD